MVMWTFANCAQSRFLTLCDRLKSLHPLNSYFAKKGSQIFLGSCSSGMIGKASVARFGEQFGGVGIKTQPGSWLLSLRHLCTLTPHLSTTRGFFLRGTNLKVCINCPQSICILKMSAKNIISALNGIITSVVSQSREIRGSLCAS